MTSHCSHVTTGVGRLTGEDLAQLLSNGVCDVCRLRSTSVNLWLCLFPDCYMMCCAESRNDDHSTNHYNTNTDHCLQLNVVNKRVFCYKCSKEVHRSRNEPEVPGVLGVEKEDKIANKRLTLDADTCWRPPGLVGLSNLGNTCYMNSALQCLSNTPSLSKFFLYCSEMIPKDSVLSQAYLKLVEEMWRNTGARYLAPTDVLHAVKKACPMFRGFQQHDSQEFLRFFMDQLHQELSEPSEEHYDEEESEEEVAAVRDVLISDTYDSSSGSLSNSSQKDGRKQKLTDHSQADDSGLGSVGSFQDDDNKLLDEFPTSHRKMSESHVNLSDMEYEDATSDAAVFSRSASTPCGDSYLPCHASLSPAKHRQPPNKRVQIRQNHSVISHIFNGKLESSVKCLACGRVSVTTEIFQDLSLPIPSQVVRQDQSQDGWFSWACNGFWSRSNGIDVTLLDCLAAFFSADELKGDNMYSCEKCKKLRNGLKYSLVVELPDTLAIHLKRFGHDTSKINTKVSFPLVDLDMSPWQHTDRKSKQTRYELTGVICHHGVAGAGHYTSYVRNYIHNEWYEFDDSFVRPVDAATVAQAEAYVLFYRKKSEMMELLRGKMPDLAEQDSPSLVQFYISNVWLTKFFSMAEPGPIDNSSVICRHGGVLPHRLHTVHYLCTEVLPAVWQTLYDKFGGCVAVNRLQRCDICYAEAEERQKKSQLEEFNAFHAVETKNSTSEAMDDM